MVKNLSGIYNHGPMVNGSTKFELEFLCIELGLNKMKFKNIGYPIDVIHEQEEIAKGNGIDKRFFRVEKIDYDNNLLWITEK